MNNNTFNGAFAKAFPERTAANIARVLRQEAALIARDPFGGETLEKRVHHFFSDGDRVRVNSPSHHTHNHTGVVKDAANDSRLEVKLDSGHTIHCIEADLVPENFAVSLPTDSASAKIAKAGWNPMAVDPDDGVLAKRARSKFSVGQEVIERGYLKRAGKITAITDGGALEIRFSPSLTGTYLDDQVDVA